jgi:hypothetical protein
VSIAYILVKIIYISADIELLARGILNINKVSAYVLPKKPCVRVDSRKCSDCVVSVRKDGFYLTRLAFPILTIVFVLDNTK